MLNLLSNAVKFTKQGKIAVTVRRVYDDSRDDESNKFHNNNGNNNLNSSINNIVNKDSSSSNLGVI